MPSISDVDGDCNVDKGLCAGDSTHSMSLSSLGITEGRVEDGEEGWIEG